MNTSKFEYMFDELVTSTAGTHGAAAVDAWARVESAACARRLAAMATMLDTAHTAHGSADRDQWCLDNWAAICAHIGAAQRLTSGATSGLLLVATALRDRLPKVGAVFAAGLIDYRLARTIVHRSMLLTDPEARHALDTALAEALQTWEPMSQDTTEHTIDTYIAHYDPHAVRRTQSSARTRSLDIVIDDGDGLASLFGTLFTPDATALHTRLDALADTTCRADPRTRDQRRADALGALAHGADRLTCLCTTNDCPAAHNPPSSGVIIHLIAHHDTLTPNAEPTRGEPQPDEPPEPGDADPETDTANALDGAENIGDAAELSNDHATATADPTADPAADECAALDGRPPPMFTTPLRDLTLTEALTNRDPGHHSSLRPAVMMGGQFLPGAVTRRAALNATLTTIIHPGQAPPEPRHTPSRKLTDFVRCRDLTCRFPGCNEPATTCDLDHTIPWPYGPTQAANLKALCRKHHLLKTFWTGDTGWREEQLTDGTVIWTAPDGRTHTTTPGSRLLFPELSEPTAPTTTTNADTDTDTDTNTDTDTSVRATHPTGLAMPRRTTTRTQDRVRRINDERELNRITAENQPPEPTPPF